MESENEKIQDEDVNNKMFIVVRNLKSTQAKNVSLLVCSNTGYNRIIV